MISDGISKGIPPRMKIINIVIPDLIHFCSFVSNWSVASHIKPHVIQRYVKKLMTLNFKTSDSIISKDILSQIFDIIQSDVALKNQVHKNCNNIEV